MLHDNLFMGVLMEKEELRNQLFSKYFEVEDGILATDLVDKLAFIPELWHELRVLCKKNIRYFNPVNSLEQFKVLEHNQKNYLIIKLGMLRYVIIDLKTKENITEEQFKNEFDDSFFINNFNEVDTKNYSNMYSIDNYNGDIQELIDFYIENKNVLSLSNELYYRLELGEAWTYFYIDFANAKAGLAFETSDQFLYEQLFLMYDLSPFGMQDAQGKIGIEKMQEMFEEIKKIKIPIEVIPNDLYQQFLDQCDIGTHKLEKKVK